MASRQDLQILLEGLTGVSAVYFQPPATVKMTYPCIVYNRSSIIVGHANNNPYTHRDEYSITVIDSDPESDIPDRVASLQSARFIRHFTTDGLHHNIFTIFY